MFDRADFKVIVLIMLMAVILALTAALAYYYLINRPEFPAGTYETTVEGETIIVESDPEMAVVIISTPAPVQPVLPVITLTSEGQGGGEDGDGGNVTVIPPPTESPIPVQPLPSTVPPPTPIPPAPLPAAPQVVFLDYQVTPGDTLYSISSRHNTTIALMARFGIDATDLVPGSIIRLPVANPAYCPGTFPYVVEEGDTLSSIARKCGTTVQNLMQINGFGPNYSLDVTSVICVPNPP